jgi:UDP-GlcNAc:undecaprenyl-phosphate GlcNAc-1-phosphate transferase
VFLVAVLMATLLTPVVRAIALRAGAVSHPGGRHIHAVVVPRLGGVAVLAAFLLPIAALFLISSSVAHFVRAEGLKVGALVAGAVAMTTVGAIDDTRGLPAMHKLFAQVVIAALAFAAGLRIEVVTLPGIGNLPMGTLAFPLTVLWIVGVVNAVNLIDGLDGLAAGIVLFAATTNFVVATVSGAVFIAVMMAALAGAVLGFLFFNFNPARIFLGDSGSYFLGFVLATSVLVGSTSQKASTAVALLVPCLALGIPIFDTLFSMVRRFLERRPLFSPDRGHLHHRLVDVGLTHKRAVLAMYAVSAVFCCAAVAIAFGNEWHVGLALFASSVVAFVLFRFAGYVEYLRRSLARRGRLRSPQVEALRRVLPDVAVRLASVANEAELLSALDGAAAALALDGFEVYSRSAGEILHSWPRESMVGRVGDGYSVKIPIGPEGLAVASLRFRWAQGSGSPAPDVEILFQLLVDMVERAATRLACALAPAIPAVRPGTQEEEVGLELLSERRS